MAIYRKFAMLMTAVMLMMASNYARAADNMGRIKNSFPKVSETMNPEYAKPHIGVMAGFSNPEGSFDTTGEYGLDVGLQPWSPLGVGLEVTRVSTERTFRGVNQNLERTNVLVKGIYNLGGTIPVVRYSYLGLGLGAVFDTSAYTGTHSGIAPLIGFDIPLTNDTANFFSLGAGAKYVFVSGPSPDSFTVNGMVKYWF